MEHDFDKRITTILEDNDFVTSYHFDLDSGYGNMFYYHLFPGIDIIYNDFNADNCNQLNQPGNYDDFIIINHCNKGRFETIFKNNYLYLSEGDLVFSIGETNYMQEFPLGFYNGFQISINLEIAQESIDKVISELYSVDDSIKEGYYKLKVMELLLFLKNSTIKNVETEYPTLKAENVKIIKDIKRYLVDNLSDNITLDDLSSQFNLSKTSIKNYFKTIYAKPLSTWRREYRLNQASFYLENTSLNIGDISEMVGYRNHGKFTDAFKQYYGMTPSEYRTSF